VPSPQASDNLYVTLQRLQLVLIGAGRKAWARMGPDFDPSWSTVAPSLLQVASAAQLAAANAATAYVPAVLAETGQPDEPEALIRPQVFSGVASDGRTLSGLLEVGVRQAKVASGRGASADRALDYGRRWLEQELQTLVTDAARDATAAQIAVRDRMGWVRRSIRRAAPGAPCWRAVVLVAGQLRPASTVRLHGDPFDRERRGRLHHGSCGASPSRPHQ
jgi:hypothetical protein